jgi:hypothetical protein
MQLREVAGILSVDRNVLHSFVRVFETMPVGHAQARRAERVGPTKTTAERKIPMETAGQDVGKIETRLRQLGTKLDRLVAKVDEVGAEAQIDYRKSIDHIKDKRALVQSRLDAYKAANGQKWESFKGGVETAWHELEDAFKAIKQ